MDSYTEINSEEEFKKAVYDEVHRKNIYILGLHIFTIPITIKHEANGVRFTNCIFKKPVEIGTEVTTTSSFNYSTFEDNVNFDGSSFEKKVRFHKTTFKSQVSFNNVQFHDLADFWGATFHKPTIFFKTDFLGVVVFSATTFKQNVLFSYTLINKIAIFRGTSFEKGVDLSLALLLGTLSLFDLKLEDYKASPDPDSEEEYEKQIATAATIPLKNKRETFRILKQQNSEQGNLFDSLVFSSMETHTYHKEVWTKVKKKGDSKSIQELVILFLNLISNNHRRSWIRGIAFTFLVGVLFAYLSILSTESYHFSISGMQWRDFETGTQYFFEFMIPTHRLDYLSHLGPTTSFYFLDFLGRTLVAYGIYQTIQAFRKFKSSG